VTGVAACAWCSRSFTPRSTGGHAQRFCGSPCRRAFDAAGRRWAAEAIAADMVTVDALRKGFAATRALLPVASSPAPVFPAEKPAPAPVASAECAQHVIVTLDRMQQMQLCELRWSDPFHFATPEEIAALASRLLRDAIPRALMASR
jgi:hypothetical protein